MMEEPEKGSEEVERKVVFWAIGDEEELTHLTVEDAIEGWFDDSIFDVPLPVHVTVQGFAPVRVIAGIEEWLIHILEAMDEEYANPETGEWTQPTKAMTEAAHRLGDVIEKEYVPWLHEPVTSVTVDLRAWAKENMPQVFPEIEWEEG